jgi:hypothetical protein
VFLGSKKFPEERAYKEFLSKNGGSSNAGRVNIEFVESTGAIAFHSYRAQLYKNNA